MNGSWEIKLWKVIMQIQLHEVIFETEEFNVILEIKLWRVILQVVLHE